MHRTYMHTHMPDVRYPLDEERGYPFHNQICWERFIVEVPHNRSAFLAAAGLLSPLPEKLTKLHLSTKQAATTRREVNQAASASFRAEFDQLVPRLLQLEPQAAAARRYMQSISSLLQFDAHDVTTGELRRPDAALCYVTLCYVMLCYKR